MRSIGPCGQPQPCFSPWPVLPRLRIRILRKFESRRQGWRKVSRCSWALGAGSALQLGTMEMDDEYASLAPKIKAAVAAITNKDVRFILNTQDPLYTGRPDQDHPWPRTVGDRASFKAFAKCWWGSAIE